MLKVNIISFAKHVVIIEKKWHNAYFSENFANDSMANLIYTKTYKMQTGNKNLVMGENLKLTHYLMAPKKKTLFNE